MTIFDMANTRRHIDLLRKIGDECVYLRKKYKMQTYQENAALVYLGHRVKDISALSLIDIDNFDTSLCIDNLNYVQPDFIIFKNNKYLWNNQETRLAGCPDLIIEIWSDSDYPVDRDVKYRIYSNSNNKTEHWYINQYENEVQCFSGTHELVTQSLKAILTTQDGLEFDLTEFSL